MPKEKLIHTGQGVELVRALANEGLRIFTNEQARQLAPAVGLSEGYLRQSLHYLVKSGWIVRLRKGLYTISHSVPGATPVHEFEVAMALVDPAAISHWSALNYHGLTEQIPRRTFILTTATAIPRRRVSKDRGDAGGYSVGNTIYQFIQVKPERFFGLEKVWASDARVTITNIERTLLDGLSRPQYFGDFAEVIHAFETISTKLNLERIIKYASKLDVATAKRLGWVLEKFGFNTDSLERLEQIPVKGYRTLDPNGPRKGPCNRRWMIQENLPGRLRL